MCHGRFGFAESQDGRINTGRAMIRVAVSEYSKHVPENPDINLLAATA
jgi:hypothetical protein